MMERKSARKGQVFLYLNNDTTEKDKNHFGKQFFYRNREFVEN